MAITRPLRAVPMLNEVRLASRNIVVRHHVIAAARPVALGKFIHAGQTCTAPDHAMVPRAKASGHRIGAFARIERR